MASMSSPALKLLPLGAAGPGYYHARGSRRELWLPMPWAREEWGLALPPPELTRLYMAVEVEPSGRGWIPARVRLTMDRQVHILPGSGNPVLLGDALWRWLKYRMPMPTMDVWLKLQGIYANE